MSRIISILKSELSMQDKLKFEAKNSLLENWNTSGQTDWVACLK